MVVLNDVKDLRVSALLWEQTMLIAQGEIKIPLLWNLKPSRTSSIKLFCEKGRQLFLQKSTIVDVWLGSKYASNYNNNFFPDVSKIKLTTF